LENEFSILLYHSVSCAASEISLVDVWGPARGEFFCGLMMAVDRVSYGTRTDRRGE